AFLQLVLTYELADSLATAERVARRWTKLEPESSRSWMSLWDVLQREWKFDEAEQVAAHIAQIACSAVPSRAAAPPRRWMHCGTLAFRFASKVAPRKRSRSRDSIGRSP